ncbi:hypothetical protein STSP2_01719 [Anaerohalosphaera lusitana]|uniref:Uncharacterized protein n=1 Tax=Anaerohalosphaera lusitana TaxID=1936003 RepID=A0A1U9NKT1_9BACT|nr:hypothetical protein [Anaerohalosphaera lusitana]AQT68552.1 hypothetical protein STSP2_01719 [Anaerohalosphaera lusitana]
MNFRKSTISLVALFLLNGFCLDNAHAAEKAELASPLCAKALADNARSLHIAAEDNPELSQVAMVLIEAAMELDPRADYLAPLALEISSRASDGFTVPRLTQILRGYVTDESDLVVVHKAVAKTLDQLDSWEQREEFLGKLFRVLRKQNSVLASELAAELGTMWFEKAETQRAANYFSQAYDLNPYNQKAFQKLDALLRSGGGGFNRAGVAVNMRYRLTENPFSLSRALDLAGFLEGLASFDQASKAYAYSAELFDYLNEDSELPSMIYLQWMLCAYNADMPDICSEIADRVQKETGFDLVTQALAIKAAVNAGTKDTSALAELGKKAEQMLENENAGKLLDPLTIAWYYSFVLPDFDKALTWANRALSAEPDREEVKAILAYAMANNGDGQGETVKELAADIAEFNQTARLAVTLSEISDPSQQQDDAAVTEKLNAVVLMSPSSLAAQKARAIMQQRNEDYQPALDPEPVISELKTRFDNVVVPAFKPVDQLVDIKLKTSSDKVSQNSDLWAKILITNNSNQDLVISDDSFLTGSILVNAKISGDVNVSLGELISQNIQPGEPIAPGDYASLDLHLSVGQMNRILTIYPQADLTLEFECILEPSVPQDGKITSSLGSTGVLTKKITRPGVFLSRAYFSQRLKALSRGQAKQRVVTVELLANLLAEQYAFEAIEPLYKAVKVERSTLVRGLKKGLQDENWIVKTATLNAIVNAVGAGNADLLSSVSAHVNDQQWPVRLMAIYLLDMQEGKEFDKVMTWFAKEDSNRLVRNLAQSLKNLSD